MKVAVCVLLAAAGASALTPPKSAVAATRGGSLEAGALKAAAAPIKEVSAVPRGGVIANFVGVDVALLSYFFFWYLGNYYCPRPRPNLRGDGAATARRRRDVKNSVAQWIAYQTSNLGVAGSSPVGVGSWAVRHRREFEKTHAAPTQTTSRTSSPSRIRAAPRASP